LLCAGSVTLILSPNVNADNNGLSITINAASPGFWLNSDPVMDAVTLYPLPVKPVPPVIPVLPDVPVKPVLEVAPVYPYSPAILMLN
jgi:hypothetical protein